MSMALLMLLGLATLIVALAAIFPRAKVSKVENDKLVPYEAPFRQFSILRLLYLAVRTFGVAAVQSLVHGKERATRSRVIDIVIRGMRNSGLVLDILDMRSLIHSMAALATVPVPVTVREVVWIVQLVSANAASSPLVVPGSQETREMPTIVLASELANLVPEQNRSWAIAAEWLVPKDMSESDRAVAPVVLYVHGGGFTFNSLRTTRMNVAPLAKSLGASLLSVEYRLSPEHEYPAALHDVVSAYLYLIRHENVDPARIVVMGDSAGGNLVLAATHFLRAHGLALPAAVVAISPWTDLPSNLPSLTSHKYDFCVTRPTDLSPEVQANTQFERSGRYYGGAAVGGPEASRDETFHALRSNTYLCPWAAVHTPLSTTALSDSGTLPPPMPPVLVTSGSDEVFFDDHVLLAAALQRMAAAGRAWGVFHHVIEHQVHEFVLVDSGAVDSLRATEAMREFITAALGNTLTKPVDDAQLTYYRSGTVIPDMDKRAVWGPRWEGIQAACKQVDWEPVY
ncbi:Alpha/Beta hydrolase protein [Blastocladiella britannica]|nr:Alpha/Beta hydrolase protein [Blastocladiella britannica]